MSKNNKSDYNNTVRTDLNKLIPEYVKTELSKSINENLFNRFFTKDDFKHVVGLIGKPNGVKGVIEENTPFRQRNQLQPVAQVKIGPDTHLFSFEDFINRAKSLGLDVDNFDTWGNATQFNWSPPVDFDKIVNFQDYFWQMDGSGKIPEYIVVKNLKTWASARWIQANKLISSVFDGFEIESVDIINNKVNLTGNRTTSFSINEYLLLSDTTNGSAIFKVTATAYSSSFNRTSLTVEATGQSLSEAFKTITKTQTPVQILGNTFTLAGEYDKLFTENYIFALKHVSGISLFSVKNASFNAATNVTSVTTQEDITEAYTHLDVTPILFVMAGEVMYYENDDSIKQDLAATDWDSSKLSSLLWTKEQIVKTNSYNGITEFPKYNLVDSSANFSTVAPRDICEILSGPSRGKHEIYNVGPNYLIFNENKRLFDSQCEYRITRAFVLADIKTDGTPPIYSASNLWWDTDSSTLQHYNGSTWNIVLRNINLLDGFVKDRNAFEFENNDWVAANKWIHKDQINDFTNKVRAQFPIIEYSSYVELSDTSYAKKTWKYRKNHIEIFEDFGIAPDLFELLDIRYTNPYDPEFQFESANTILLHQKYGNLTATLVDGYKVNLSGFESNDGVYEVASSEFVQPQMGKRWATRIKLKTDVPNPFDYSFDGDIGNLTARITPVLTKNGDPWLNNRFHWLLHNVEVVASSTHGSPNPMTPIYVNSYNYSDDTQNITVNTHYGFNWQEYSLVESSSLDASFDLHGSLHDLVLYDNYQEGDVRVYINGVRQYGNFVDNISFNSPNFIGGIKFINTLLTPDDTIRVELGEYTLEDIGLRAVDLPVFTKSSSTTEDFDTGLTNPTNLANIRHITQTKTEIGQHPFFNIYDIDGTAKIDASLIFGYSESSDSDINTALNKRVKYDIIRKDYTFAQYLSDPTTGELFCYRDRSKNVNDLFTIWKVGNNNEQAVPRLVDNEWELPNQLYFNLDHKNKTEVKLSDLYRHFSSIIENQSLEGLIPSNGKPYYLDDDVNYGIGGTIKEHNDGFDLLYASLFANNANPISIIKFAQEMYLYQLRYMQNIFVENIAKLLTTTTLNSYSDISAYVAAALKLDFENDEKFDQWFGDSTTYNAVTKKGVKNWIATAPYLGLAAKVAPMVLIDQSKSIYDVIHHDGHVGSYEIIPSVREQIYNLIKKMGTLIPQTVTTEKESFPSGLLENGTFCVRSNTTTKTRKLYRYNITDGWFELDMSILLTDTILNIEKSLYENVPDLDPSFNFGTITGNVLYDDLMEEQFGVYTSQNNIDTPYSITNTYDQNNPFTWNYFYTLVPQNPVTGVANTTRHGSWQALYENVYGTSYPHLEPWKLQGYTSLPVWWNGVYASVNSGRKWNSLMWSNILNGIIPSGEKTPSNTDGTGVSGQVTSYSFVSVNIGDSATLDGLAPDALLPPYWNTINTTNPKIRSLYDPNVQQFITTPNFDFEFGQNGKYEYEWKHSLDRIYDQFVIAFKLQPMRFLHKTYGRKYTIVNCLQVDNELKKVYSHKDIQFHGDLDSNNQLVISHGLNQWYVHYARYNGFDGISSELKSFWKEWDTKLTYLAGSFIDAVSFRIYNENFDITERDYDILVKESSIIDNKRIDALITRVLSIPSKYSKLRERGANWIFQMNSASPNYKTMDTYGVQNYGVRMVSGSSNIRVNSYNLHSAGIDTPYGYQLANYNQLLRLNSPTQLSNTNSVYYANVLVDGTITKELKIKGHLSQTVEALLKQINKQLGSSALAELDLGNIKISSNTVGSASTISTTDAGLFATLHTNFTGFSNSIQTTFKFKKFFNIEGNYAKFFVEGETFKISNSTQFNGTYTIKSAQFEVDTKLTKILVNENVSVTSVADDGVIEPDNFITLPSDWVDGTEVFLNSDGYLPTNLSDVVPYFFKRIDDRTFSLHANPNLVTLTAIVPNSDPVGTVYVGKLQATFKALDGSQTDYTWRHHAPDKRFIIKHAQSEIISGIQSLVDFIFAYNDYHEDLGFFCINPNGENYDPKTGRTNDWQYEIESYINWLFQMSSIRQQDELKYDVEFDSNSHTINLTNGSINWETGDRVVLFADENSSLPENLDNPLTRFVPYYLVRNYESTTSFQLALTKLDALKGRYIEFSDNGHGDLYVEKSRTVQPLTYTLNPFKNYIWVKNTTGIMSNLFAARSSDVSAQQLIYDTSGSMLTKNEILVIRNDKETRISLIGDLIEKNQNINSFSRIAKREMGGMNLYYDGYENAISFNDYSIDGTLIYDSFLGLNIPRFDLEYNKQNNFNLRPNVGGYFYNDKNLVQNFESLTDDLRYLYDTNKSIEQKQFTKLARKTLGYDTPKDYMDDLNINPKSQFLFWKGMIKNKGTNFAVNAFTNQLLFKDVNVDEFWAYKIAEFGDNKEKNFIEMKLLPSDSYKNEFRAEFVLPDEDASNGFTPIALTDPTRWWDQPQQLETMIDQQSFYFDAEVIEILTLNVNKAVARYINGFWYMNLGKKCDGVFITHKNRANGKIETLVNGIDYEMINSQVIRFTPTVSLSSSKAITGNGIEALEGISSSSSLETIESETNDIGLSNPNRFLDLKFYLMRYNYNAQNPARLIDRQSGTVVNTVPIWNPAFGQYYYNAIAMVDVKTSYDPATYNSDIAESNPESSLWGKDKVGTIWFFDNDEGYLPYYDVKITNNVNDRIQNWGAVSDWNNIELYEWVESPVPPDQWESIVQADLVNDEIAWENKRTGTVDKFLYKNLSFSSKTKIQWQKQLNRHFEIVACLITPETKIPLTDAVELYINGKFTAIVNLDAKTLLEILVDFKHKPHDFIRLIKRIPNIDKENALYKDGGYVYTTPYTVVSKFDENTNAVSNNYYFWVSKSKNKKLVNQKYLSVNEAREQVQQMPAPYIILQNLVSPDFGYGLVYGKTFDQSSVKVPWRFTQMIVKNLQNIVKDFDRYTLRFIRDFTLRDSLIMSTNSLHSPLYLKNKHEEWKMFRINQLEKIDFGLWLKMIEGIIGHTVHDDGSIDYANVIPSLNRVLYDSVYHRSTSYGLGAGQSFVDQVVGKGTLLSILSDPKEDYGFIDIDQFMSTHKFNTAQEIYDALIEIYNNFDIKNINKIFFEVFHDALSMKYESPDFFKTSWVSLKIGQEILTGVNNPYSLPYVERGGICETPIVDWTPVPTALPQQSLPVTPTPTPTPLVTTSITPTPTPTITLTRTPNVTVTPTPTVTPTVTPTHTATPSITPSQFVSGYYLVGGDFSSINGTAKSKLAKLGMNATTPITGYQNYTFDYGPVQTMAFQNDGKVLVVGLSTGGFSQITTSFFRLNIDGSIDTSFNYPVMNGLIKTMVVQPDGKILIGGTFTGMDDNDAFHVARLNSDGSLDTTFNAEIDTNAKNSRVEMIRLYSTGYILVAGVFDDTTSSGGELEVSPISGLIRLTPTGERDYSFSPSLNGNDGVFNILLQNNNKIMVAEKIDSQYRVYRLGVDGLVDETFTMREFDAPLSSYDEGIQLLPDGTYIVYGEFQIMDGSLIRRGLARLGSDGSDLDTSFNNFDPVYSVSVRNGSYITAGEIFSATDRRINKFDIATSELDESFSSNANAVVTKIIYRA